MAEEAPESETVHVKTEVQDQVLSDNIESQIQQAMHSRISHFKDQANSLTFEGVRRLLEKDLRLETYALDVHKRFIKQCLLKCLEGVNDDDLSKNSGEAEEKTTCRDHETEPVEKTQSNKEIKESFPDDEEKMEDSPVLGLLKTQKSVKPKASQNEAERGGAIPSDITIKKAIRKRIPYIKANSEKLTMAGFRRLLEEDLKLDKFTLDPCKKFISQQLDEVLQSIEVPEPKTNGEKITKKVVSKAPKEARSEESSESSAEDSDSEEEAETKPRKKTKGTMPKSDGLKKRKTSAEQTDPSKSKRLKHAKAPSENDTDQEDGGNDSDDDRSESTPEKPAKKKEVLTPAYGKRVEHLKSVIKACGMSVAPSVYKKVKQVPENKREAHLIKELEEILSREGLSSNPSEKEIKDVRRKKERARELEGIDVSNIVSSSRRRSTSSFAVPPKPKIQVEKAEDAEDSEDEDEDEEDDDNDNDDEEEEDEEADNSDDGDSGSEEDDEE